MPVIAQVGYGAVFSLLVFHRVANFQRQVFDALEFIRRLFSEFANFHQVLQAFINAFVVLRFLVEQAEGFHLLIDGIDL